MHEIPAEPPPRRSVLRSILTVLASLCLLCCGGLGTVGVIGAYRSHVETQRRIECVKNDKPIEARGHPLRQHFAKNQLDFGATYNDKVLQFRGKVSEITREYITINDGFRVVCYFDDLSRAAAVANGDEIVVKGYFRGMSSWGAYTQKIELYHCQLVPEK